MDKFFKVTEHGSTVKTEVVAGITTFMAMAYILMVNSSMFAELGTVSYNAIYIATAISAVIGTASSACSPICLWLRRPAWGSMPSSSIPSVSVSASHMPTPSFSYSSTVSYLSFLL